MKTSKILFASLIAAAAMSTVPAWAVTSTTTELDGVTYSGTIWTTNVSGVNSGTNLSAAGRTYTSGETSYAGNASISGVKNFYNYFFNGSESTYVGNTLRLTGATADHTVTTDFMDYAWLGGLITDACDYTYTIGRSNTSLRLKGTAGVNMSINADTVIWGDKSNISVESGGSWVIASGKTLTLQSTKSVTFAESTTTTVSGGGTLKFTGAVSNAGTLALSGAKVALTSAITNTGTVSVDTNTVFVLKDALKSENTYTLISTGGEISGWDSLKLSNFRQSDGSTFGRSSVDVTTTAGAVTITAEAAASLVWNGGASGGTWDDVQTTKNWLNNEVEDVFYSGDSVTFNTENANVTVSGTVKPGTMTVSAATTLSGTGTVAATSLSATSALTLESGVTLQVGTVASATGTATNDFSLVKGTGTLSVILPDGNGLGVNASDFAGTLYVQKGATTNGSRLQLTATTLADGASIELADGADMVLNAKMPMFAHNIKINGSSELYFNKDSSATVEFSGDISGAGTLSLNVSNNSNVRTLDLSGKVELGGLTVGTNKTVNIAGEGSAISDLRISAGTANITAGSATITGDQTLVGNLTIGGNATVYVGKTDSLKYGASNTVTVNEGGTLDMGNYRWTVGANNKIVLAGGTITGTGDDKGALDFFESGTVTAKANTESEISANLRLRKDDNSPSVTETFSTETSAKLLISGKVTDGGAMKKSGEGTLTLTGENSYTGGTTISAGTLVAKSASALGTGTVTVETNGTLKLGTDEVSIGTLSGAGTIGLATGTTSSTLTVNQTANGTFSGSIGGELVSIVKNGTGTLELSGTTVLYKYDFSTQTASSGDVTVNAGTLKLSGDGHVTAGTLSVKSGATLNLVGATAARATLQSVEISEGAKIVIDMSAFADKTETFALDILTTSALKYNGKDITTEVSTLLTNGVVSLSGWDKTGWTESLSYASGTQTLTLTMTVPEPSTFGLLAGVGALAFVAARRRRRAK